MPPQTSCTVLLCTFNGATYLEEQLRSIAHQTLQVINLYVSDDGSTDETISILQRWQQGWSKGDFLIWEGPRRGFSENFRSVILKGPSDHFVAFSDQDDIWHPDKLEKAIEALDTVSLQPALYGSRSMLVGGDGQKIGLSPLFQRPPSFANALVESLAGGNTMVLNQPAFQLMQESARRTTFLMHDWWAYLIISGAGGRVHYDPIPHIYYRQHSNNVLGGSLSLLKRPQRAFELWNGKYVNWNAANLSALEVCHDLLGAQARMLVEDFQRLRDRGSIGAMQQLRSSGIYRQTAKGDIALAIAAFFKKL